MWFFSIIITKRNFWLPSVCSSERRDPTPLLSSRLARASHPTSLKLRTTLGNKEQKNQKEYWNIFMERQRIIDNCVAQQRMRSSGSPGIHHPKQPHLQFQLSRFTSWAICQHTCYRIKEVSSFLRRLETRRGVFSHVCGATAGDFMLFYRHAHSSHSLESSPR